MKSLLVRVDASKKIGMGHIVRCLTLADALKKDIKGLKVTFFTKIDECKEIIVKHYKKTILYVMPWEKSLDIDNSIYFLTEALIKSREENE